MTEAVNRYSQRWFDTFLETHAFTRAEVDFLSRQLPNPPYKRVLDVCCGRGRHANELALLGYAVLGIDIDDDALAIAAARAPAGAKFLNHDMRDVRSLGHDFDAVLVLWQSFGFFDHDTNRRVFADFASILRAGGRLILDLYNRDYWETATGTGLVERGGVRAEITNTLRAGRLTTVIDYGGLGERNRFDWELYGPVDLPALGRESGLDTVLICTECDETKACTPEFKALQVVYERRA